MVTAVTTSGCFQFSVSAVIVKIGYLSFFTIIKKGSIEHENTDKEDNNDNL